MRRRRSGMRCRVSRNYYVPPQEKEESARRGEMRRPPSRRRKARRRRIIRRAARLAAIAALLLVMTVSAANLAAYAADYIMARRASDKLRESYRETEEWQIEEQTALVPTPAAAESPEQCEQDPGIALPQETAPLETPVPNAQGNDVLAPKPYPANPQATVRERFSKLRRQNKDIVGWLTIDGMLDEAVVKRDNAYYLTRDYRGYHNVNGAIFMDENCSLKTRPYTVMLFGHNMKTGLMFGRLRDYENIRFYREHPFITFDTAYENGRYVVFAAATIGLDPAKKNYLDLNGLLGDNVKRRSRAISRLKELSVHTAMIEVEAQDQILLLITCVDDDMERRVVAARRVRPGESEEQIARWVRETDRK